MQVVPLPSVSESDQGWGGTPILGHGTEVPW